MDRIPKKLHMYWDKSPMSKLQVFTIETFHRLNPEWEVFVYTPLQNYTRNAHYIPDYTGKDYFQSVVEMDYVKMVEIDIHKYGIDSDLHNILRSDIFRYHILYECGGMWADFDVVWLKPISHMNNINCVGNIPIKEMGATACLLNMTHGHHNIGVLFSVPQHALYKALIAKSIEIQNRHVDRDKYDHQAFGVWMWGQLYATLQDVISTHPDVVGIPYNTFAPYSIFNMGQLYYQNDVSPLNDNNVIGLHWFNGHVYSKQYINNRLFDKGYVCSLTTVLKNLGYSNV
jgi:hypothetical protein